MEEKTKELARVLRIPLKEASEIDDGMVDIILTLNKKGYPTAFCCEGHWDDYYNCYHGAYISFNCYIEKDLFPKTPSHPWIESGKTWSKVKTPIMEVGMGYKNNIETKEKDRVFYWTGTRYKRMSREEKDREHEQMIKEIMDWAEWLPNRKRK